MRTLQLLLVLAVSVTAIAILPSSASAAFGISNYTLTPSTKQAASHPTVTTSFNRTGSESEDLSAVKLDLPQGMFANPESVTSKCTDTLFNQDKCIDSQMVGTMSVDITAASILNQTIPGAVYVLQPRADEAATLGLIMRPNKICILFVFCATPSKVFLKTGISVRTWDSETAEIGVRTITSNAPKTTTVGIPLIVTSLNMTLDITIKKMTLVFQSRSTKAKTGKYFMVASSACKPSISKIEIISNSNVSAKATSSYTPTGCAVNGAGGSVPFNPTFTYAPTDTTAGAASATKFTLFIPQADATIQNAHPKVVDIDFPNDSAVELGALSGITGCTEVLLRADNCPADSQIGTASSNAPMLPPDFTGSVYAMDPINTAVPMAVVLRGARGSLVIFRGILGARTPVGGPNRAYARFDAIPQLPYASVTVNLTKPVYRNPNPSVCGTQTSRGTITGFNGSTAPGYADGTTKSPTATYTLTGCNPAPQTTITAGPPSTSSDVTPTFSYASSMTGSSFVCKIDASADIPCNDNNVSTATTTTGSYTSLALANGSHTFSVYAVNGVTADSTPATVSFTISTTFTITPTVVSSTTTPAAHPNLGFTADVAGGQPASITIKLPDGFAASLSSRPLCSAANAAAGTCATASSIGSVSLTLDKFGGPETAVGEAFLTAGPTSTDAGGISIKVPFSFGTFIAQGGAYLVSNGKNQFIDIRNIPATVGSTAVNVTQLKINFTGATGNLLTNATSCAPSAFIATGIQTDGVGASPITTPYQSTGCSESTPPFAPTLTQALSNPVAGTPSTPGLTGVVADITMPPNNGTIKKMVVKEPAVLVPNFESFGSGANDQCIPGAIVDTDPSAATNFVFNYSAANCPVQAKVGTMTINTPLLSSPLVGDVYLVNRGSLPSFGVKFDQPGISVRLVGITRLDAVSCNETIYDAGCPDQIQLTFDNVPDTPITSVNFALNQPDRPNYNNTVMLSGKLLQTAQHFDTYICRSSSPAETTVTSWAGQVRLLSQPITISGCDPQP